jgi:hypothetical protein
MSSVNMSKLAENQNNKPKNGKKNNNQVWDYIIIGAGIAGLYAAYRIRQHADPSARILVLEAGCRIGGRMAMVDFHGVQIEPGAGIGRLEKDTALRGLLDELGLSWQEFPVAHNYSTAAYKLPESSTGSRKAKLGRIGRAAKKVVLPKSTDKLPTPDWIKKQIGKLRAAYKKNPTATTFHAFALKVLGHTVYQQLVLALGYTDYEKEDVAETLFHYGMEDLYAKWTGMGIDWQELMDTLVEHSFAEIRLNTRAVRITHSNNKTSSTTNKTSTNRSDAGSSDTGIFTVNTSYIRQGTKQSSDSHKQTNKTIKRKPQLGMTRMNIPNLPASNSIGCSKTRKHQQQVFTAMKVIIATTIAPARELVTDFMTGQNLRVPFQLSGVQGQSFLRIYGYFTGKSRKIMEQYVSHTQVVPGKYHRVIPMGKNKTGSVYMIVYTDNRAADDLEHLHTNTPDNRKQLATGLKVALGIPIETPLEIADILGYYWREGTHYYTPLNHKKFGSRDEFLWQLQRIPTIGGDDVGVGSGGLFLAGEAFSRHQGWVEGALESVDGILGDLV